MSNLKGMKKEELIDWIEELEETLVYVSNREPKVKVIEQPKSGRKEQVLEYLKTNGPCRVSDIAKAIGISDRNVSSQLTYLRRDGVAIATNSKGYKFIEG